MSKGNSGGLGDPRITTIWIIRGWYKRKEHHGCRRSHVPFAQRLKKAGHEHRACQRNSACPSRTGPRVDGRGGRWRAAAAQSTRRKMEQAHHAYASHVKRYDLAALWVKKCLQEADLTPPVVRLQGRTACTPPVPTTACSWNRHLIQEPCSSRPPTCKRCTAHENHAVLPQGLQSTSKRAAQFCHRVFL